MPTFVTEMTLLAKLSSEDDIFCPVHVCEHDILTETIERINPIIVKKGLDLHIEYNACSDPFGAGIPEKVLPYLFHRFVKGADGDTGLGLDISRAIVERSGGLITAGNGEYGGAVVSSVFQPWFE